MASVARQSTRNLLKARTSISTPSIRAFHQSSSLHQKTPEQIGEAFLSKFANGQQFVRKQLLDANQARLFSLTLDRTQLWPGSESLDKSEPAAGTPLPAGYHNAYFTPAQVPGALGIDGTDTSYNPVHRPLLSSIQPS